MVDITTLVKMFRDGFITEYSFCSEIQRNIKNQVRTNVIIGADAAGSSSCSFLVSCLPIKIETGYKLDIIIDRKMLTGTAISPENVDRLITAAMNNGEAVIFELNKELSKLKMMDLPLSELIKMYLRIYKKSLSILPADIVQKATEDKIINAVELDDYILSLEGSYEKVSDIIETIAIKDLMPSQFIDAAKTLSNECEKLTYFSDEKPESNPVDKSLKGVVTNPEKSEWEHKDLPYNYVPTTMR